MKRHVAVDSKRTFAVILRPEPEGGFTVRVPALPEIVTYGADEAEALAMAKEAIELSLEYRLSQGDELPADDAPRMLEVTVDVPAAA
jgi:antitoxin HicB